MSILVTGHRGYIGSALMKYLQEHSLVKTIVGYDLVDGNDILDYDSLLETLKKHEIKIVVHLAAMSSVTACNEDPTKADRVNGYGTRLLLQAMKAAGCQNIIYASTSSVYGNSKELPYVEHLVTQPCSAYGSSKLLGEKAIQSYYGVDSNPGSYLIFRMFNVVGTSGYPDIDKKMSAGYDRLFAALESGHIIIYGQDYPTTDGTGERDYVALKDVCEAFHLGIQAINTYDTIHDVLNISSETLTSVQTMVNIWNKISDCIKDKKADYESHPPLLRVEYTYGPRRTGDPAQVYGVNTRAKRVLNWRPQRKIEDIIHDLVIDKNTPDVQSTTS